MEKENGKRKSTKKDFKNIQKMLRLSLRKNS